MKSQQTNRADDCDRTEPRATGVAGGIGYLLKRARQARAVSQLELALRLGVSQRHVSFVERGRSRPSRKLLVAWLREVDVPVPARAAVLLRAGYAGSAFGLEEIGYEELAQIVNAHAPLPAMLLDADWRIHLANESSRRLCAMLMPRHRIDITQPLDAIALADSAGGLLSVLSNAPAVAAALLRQLRTEEWARPQLKARIDAFEANVKMRFRIDERHLSLAGPLSLKFASAAGALSFHVVRSVPEPLRASAPDSARIELWCPADDQTRSFIAGQWWQDSSRRVV